jgi:hypothetical protein
VEIGEMMDNVTEIREQYAEQLAVSYERSADNLRKHAKGHAEKENYQQAHDTYQRAEFFDYIVQDLRRPKNIRLENERIAENDRLGLDSF